MVVRLYFDLNDEESWARRELEREIAALHPDPLGRIAIADQARDAEAIFKFSGPLLSKVSLADEFRTLASRDTTQLVWDSSDQPAGRHNGLYCSLDKRIFDPSRHATFSYPISYNEIVDYCDPEDAHLDFSFHGGITSGVRRRLVKMFEQDWADHNAHCHVQGGPWDAMFDRSGVDSKKRYAEALRRTKFILCPRGNGLGSIRLFEVLKAGRVPVIISDRYVLPSHIDWTACSLIVPEAEIASIPSRIASSMDRWSSLAQSARQVWETNFSAAGTLWYLGGIVPRLVESSRTVPAPWPARLRHLRGVAAVKAEMGLKASVSAAIATGRRLVPGVGP